jgi:hypothetical protein
MWVMAVAVDWIIVTLVMSLVGLWVIAQLRIWRTTRRGTSGQSPWGVSLTPALATLVGPRGD